MEKAAIYKIMKEIKGRLRHLRPAAPRSKKTKVTSNLIAVGIAAEKQDGPMTISGFAAATGVSDETNLRILTEELGLAKKSACRVHKLLPEAQNRIR